MNAAERPLGLVHQGSRLLVRLYFGHICRVRLDAMELPATGFVISMNHRSAWDMVLYWAILPRRIKFLAKKELFSYPLLNSVLARWCIPVDRGRYDRRALSMGIHALHEGYVLSVFPEGTRHAQLAAGHGGAVLMAAKAGVPVVPGAITGNYGPGQELIVHFGRPISLPTELTRQEREDATAELMRTIRDLGATPVTPRTRWRDRWRPRRRPRRPGGHDNSSRVG